MIASSMGLMATHLQWPQPDCTDPTFALLFDDLNIDVSSLRKERALVIGTKIGGLKELHDRALHGIAGTLLVCLRNDK